MQQDCEKTKIISQMVTDEAFGTFDWVQKILPQEYRESQRKYYGKKVCRSLLDHLSGSRVTLPLLLTILQQ